MSQDREAQTTEEKRLLTFLVADQEYGIKVEQAREVVGLLPIDIIPQTPDFLLGVTNLRGKIVPVIDLRLKLGLPKTIISAETCMVVVTVNSEETGVLVDFLVGVVTYEEIQLQEGLDLGDHLDTRLIGGMLKLDRRVIAVLDAPALVESLAEAK